MYHFKEKIIGNTSGKVAIISYFIAPIIWIFTDNSDEICIALLMYYISAFLCCILLRYKKKLYRLIPLNYDFMKYLDILYLSRESKYEVQYVLIKNKLKHDNEYYNKHIEADIQYLKLHIEKINSIIPTLLTAAGFILTCIPFLCNVSLKGLFDNNLTIFDQMTIYFISFALFGSYFLSASISKTSSKIKYKELLYSILKDIQKNNDRIYFKN